MSDTIKDFESAIAELEQIVGRLEAGEMSLDASLGLFERGIALSRYCHEQIGSAERRIEQLTEKGDVRDASFLADADGDDR